MKNLNRLSNLSESLVRSFSGGPPGVAQPGDGRGDRFGLGNGGLRDRPRCAQRVQRCILVLLLLDAVPGLVERFDIEPLSDFSAK